MLSDYPTFLVIGVQKGGTGWLYQMIKQHPEVSVSQPKELQFFDKAYYYKKGTGWYKDQFDLSSTSKAAGDFTPNYFWTSSNAEEINESGRNKNIPELVRNHYPNIKLIVSLRDPVDRAVSAYFHHMRAGRISPKQDFLSVINRFGIRSMGYYDTHLTKWLECFPRNSLLVLIYESDLSDGKKKQTLRKVFQHISVDDSFEPENLRGRVNTRMSHYELHMLGIPRNLRKLICRLTPNSIRSSKRWKIEISEDALARLREIYAPHNERLENLLGRDLPWSR